MTERFGRLRRRGGTRLTASGLVAATTVGVTGVTVAWAVATAPTPGPAQAAQQLAQQLGTDEAQVAKLQQTIAAERSQLAALAGGGGAGNGVAAGPGASTAAPATPGAAAVGSAASGTAAVAGSTSVTATGGTPASSAAAAGPAVLGQRRRGRSIGRCRVGRARGHGPTGHLAPGDRASGHVTPDHRSPAGHDHHPRLGQRAVTAPAPVLGSTRAMASDITLFGTATTVDGSAVDEAFACFATVQDACTRFDPDSPLMRANARPDEWHAVPPVLFDALRESYRAYVRTGGRFDPRVHDDLVRLGYDRSLRFAGDPVETAEPGRSRGAGALGAPLLGRPPGGGPPRWRAGRPRGDRKDLRAAPGGQRPPPARRPLPPRCGRRLLLRRTRARG